VHGFYRSNLYYQVQACADDQEKISWLLQAVKQNLMGRILIYCGTRKITEEVAGLLSESQKQVGFYHGTAWEGDCRDVIIQNPYYET
jgi:ATP-dependent DNA helicase RecQ